MSFIQTMVSVAGNEIESKVDGLYHPLAGAIGTWDGAMGSADAYAEAGLGWLGALPSMADYQISLLEDEAEKGLIESNDIADKAQHIRSFVNLAESADVEDFKSALRADFAQMQETEGICE